MSNDEGPSDEEIQTFEEAIQTIAAELFLCGRGIVARGVDASVVRLALFEASFQLAIETGGSGAVLSDLAAYAFAVNARLGQGQRPAGHA